MPVKVCALQWAPIWEGASISLRLLDKVLSDLEGADLVLLPEAAFTGYVSPWGDYDLRPFAEPLDGPTASQVAALAARHKIALGAPLIELDGTRCFNSLLLFDDSGRRIGHWRKRHPWIPETWATPGDLGSPVVEWRGLRICAAICYDLHFLDEAVAELERSDLLLFPSAWVEEGPDTRVPALQALAQRFELTIVNANWAHSAPAMRGQGDSVIVGPDGSLLARAQGDDIESVLADVP